MAPAARRLSRRGRPKRRRREERRRDRLLLLEALAREGLLARERFGAYLSDDGEPVYDRELGEAILVYLARSRARLMLVQIEDVAGECEQANLPGTTDSHPNWRRRLHARLDELLAGPEMARIAALVTEARRRSAAEWLKRRRSRPDERGGHEKQSLSGQPTGCNSTRGSPSATPRRSSPISPGSASAICMRRR